MRKKDIKGYEGLYYVTDACDVWSYDRKIIINIKNKPHTKKGKKLKNSLKDSGYLGVALYKNRKRKDFLVHRIVATAFLKRNSGQTQVNHINGIKTDNRVVNLEWCTPLENTRHAINRGFFSKYLTKAGYVKKKFLTESDVLDIRKMLKDGEKQSVLAKKYSVGQEHISKINTKKRYRHIK